MLALVLIVIAVIATVIGVIVLFSAKKDETKAGAFGTIIVVWIVALAVTGFSAFFTIGAGEVGVRFDPLGGGIQPDEYTEGLHIKAPWVGIHKFNIKTQDYTMSAVIEEGELARDDRIVAVTSEGLYVDLDITVLFRINPEMADVIRQEIGEEGQYQAIVVRPTIRSTIREVISRFEAAEVYGESRVLVEAAIEEEVTSSLEERHIQVEKVLLRSVGLPALLTTAIEEKKQAEQEALRMEYILLKEAQEKDRKIIEAEGIAKANEIISGSLTSAYLTWYWIDKLELVADVIYVPIGADGLPLFKEID